MAANVEIILTAKDQASGVIKGVGDSLGGLDGAFDGLAKVGGFVTAGLVATGGALTALVGKSVMAAGRVDELAIVNKVLAENAGIAYDEMRAAADAVKDMGIEAGVAEGTIAKMIQAELDLSKASDLARISQDAAVIAGTNSSEAYDAIIHGITTLNPLVLRNQGLIVDAQAEYKILADSLGKSVEELTGAEKQMAMMNGVIEAGIGIQGAYEAAMENPIKQLGSFKRYLDDIFVAAGEPFLGAFSGMIDMIAGWLKWLGEAIAEGGAFRETLERIAESVSGFVEHVIEYIPIAIEWFSNVWNYLKENEGIIVGIFAALGVAVVAFTIKATIALGALLIPFLPIIAIMAAVGVAVGLLYTVWKNNFGGIQGHTANFVAWVTNTFNTFMSWLSALWEAHGEAIMSTAKAIWDTILDIINYFVDQWKLIFEAFRLAFEGDWEGFGEKLREVWDNAWDKVKEIFNNVKDWFAEVIPKVIETIINFFKETDWKQLGIDIIMGLINGIKDSIGSVVNIVKSVASAIGGAFMGFFGIGSPSKLMAEIGQNLMEGMAIGIKSKDDLPSRAAGEAAVDVTRSMVNHYNLTINTSAPYEPIVEDYEMMKSWAGA